MVRNISSVAFAIVLVMVRPLLAQSQSDSAPGPTLGGGFALPMDVNNYRIGEITGGYAAPAIWAEASFLGPSRMSFHTSFDLPASYETRWRHQGSAGFDAEIRHQDIVVSQLIGFPPRHAGRAQFIPLAGFGLVFARSVQSTSFPPFSTSGRDPTRTVETHLNPSVLGGLNVSIALNRRASIVARIRARATRRNENEPDDLFGWFSITPGVGLQIAFR